MSEDKNIGLTIKYDDDDWNGWEVTFGKTTYKLAKKYSDGLHYIDLPNIPNTVMWDKAVHQIDDMVKSGRLRL